MTPDEIQELQDKLDASEAKNHFSLNLLCYTCQVPYPCSIISNDK